MSNTQESFKGCGSSECFGHGDYAVCGQRHYTGIHICDSCKLKLLVKQRDDLLAALKELYSMIDKNYHVDDSQMPTYQKAYDLIAKCEAENGK